jgi:Fic family protein
VDECKSLSCLFTLNTKSGNSSNHSKVLLAYKAAFVEPKKNPAEKEWDKIDALNGMLDDIDLSLPTSVQRVTKSVDKIIYEKLKKQKSITIPYIVEQLDIPETTARRALKRLAKSKKIKSRYEMRKLDDGVFHKHHVFYT